MSIIHIKAPGLIPLPQFTSTVASTALLGTQAPVLSTCEAYSTVDKSMRVGTWQASPGQFRRAVVEAEFSHFVAGRASFECDDGQRYEFRAGDAAYFARATKGTWTVHETLRKTYVVWSSATEG